MLVDQIASRLSAEDAALLRGNFKGVERDPLVVAAIAALAHLRDKVTWGILPSNCAPELRATYGAQIASAVSGNYARLDAYREQLATIHYSSTNDDLLRLVAHAMALGFQDKWSDQAAGGSGGGVTWRIRG